MLVEVHHTGEQFQAFDSKGNIITNREILELISFENAELVILSFSDGKTKLKFNHVYNKDVDMSQGEVLFKINEQNANSIRGMKSDTFYISIDNGTDETMVTKGKFISN